MMKLWKEILAWVLMLMISYDFSLHLAELLGTLPWHPLCPVFPSRGAYTIFWTLYWGAAFVMVAVLVWKGERE